MLLSISSVYFFFVISSCYFSSYYFLILLLSHLAIFSSYYFSSYYFSSCHFLLFTKLNSYLFHRAIRHPFIVGFCGVCLHKSTGLYIVTEFIEGGDVRSVLKKREMDWATRVQIALDLAKAMYYLHSKKIIHRDLKSKNLLMGIDKRIRLCDFGFARITDFTESKAMTICGTPGFVAPEIMMGKEYDEKCDTFSFGNVLAELITYRRPGKDFWVRSAQDGYQLRHSDLKGKVASDCPRKFLELCLLCCEYSPKDRPSFEMIVKSLVLILKDVQQQDAKKNNTATPNLTNNSTNPQTSPVPSQRMHPTSPSSARGSMPEEKSMIEISDLSYVKTISDRKTELTSNEVIISDKHLKKMISKATTPDYSGTYSISLQKKTSRKTLTFFLAWTNLLIHIFV